jgi:hypothetical protein
MAQDERPGRDVLPIPDRQYAGLITYDVRVTRRPTWVSTGPPP